MWLRIYRDVLWDSHLTLALLRTFLWSAGSGKIIPLYAFECRCAYCVISSLSRCFCAWGGWSARRHFHHTWNLFNFSAISLFLAEMKSKFFIKYLTSAGVGMLMLLHITVWIMTLFPPSTERWQSMWKSRKLPSILSVYCVQKIE